MRYQDDNEQNLTPMDRAVIEQHLLKLQSGVYTSQSELRNDLRHPAMSLKGDLGNLVRATQENKMVRTQQAGFSVAGDNRVVDIKEGFKRAGAVKNLDGSIDAGATSPDAPNGKTGSAVPQEPRKNVSVETLHGGTQRATVNRFGLSEIPKDPERVAAEEAAEKRKQAATPLRIEPLPTKK